MVERPQIKDRPPTRRDRNVAAILDSLPCGQHMIIMEPANKAMLMRDGSFGFFTTDGKKRITIIPHGAERTETKLEEYDNGTEGSRAQVEGKAES